MKEIDTTAWADFRVGSLFEVVNGRKYPLTWRVPGDIPLVSTSRLANGVSAEVGFPEGSDYVTHSNLITVAYSGSVGATFYHEGSVFVGETVMGLLPRQGIVLTRATGLFLAAVIEASVSHFTYEHKLKVSDMRERISIRLPITSSGYPDWDYMEQTMCDVFAQQERELDALTLLSAPHGTDIDTTHWQCIPMAEVFEMKNTKSITAVSLVPDSGTTPYVTSQEGDNGVQMYVDCPEEWLDKGDCIMIGGKTLTFSYQKQDFCSNDSHNIALYSRASASKSEHCQLFLISALRASLEQIYSWGDSISMKRIKEDAVMLPVTAAGDPDWSYMEQTMRDAMAEREAALDSLQTLVGV